MLALLTVATSIVACTSPLPIGLGRGADRGGWVWPTPAPLPQGATPISLEVAPIPDAVRPNAEYGACPLALLEPFTVRFVPGDAAHPIRYLSTATNAELHLIWPAGFSARLAPRLEIVAPDGSVLAREGVPTAGLGGGVLGDDNTFTICIGEYAPRRAN